MKKTIIPYLKQRKLNKYAYLKPEIYYTRDAYYNRLKKPKTMIEGFLNAEIKLIIWEE